MPDQYVSPRSSHWNVQSNNSTLGKTALCKVLMEKNRVISTQMLTQPTPHLKYINF